MLKTYPDCDYFYLIDSIRYELHNLAMDKDYLEKVTELRALLVKEMNDYGDNLNITRPGWGFSAARCTKVF